MTENHGVGGSIPPLGTIYFNDLDVLDLGAGGSNVPPAFIKCTKFSRRAFIVRVAAGTVAASWGAPAAGTAVAAGQFIAKDSAGRWNVQGLLGDGGPSASDVESRRLAMTLTFPATLAYVRTAGFAAAGDGGAALYKKVGIEPAHAGKFQSTDGAWWELAEKQASVCMFGCKANGITDDTAALQAAANSGYPLFIPAGGNVLIANPVGINCPNNFKLHGPGKITASPISAGPFKVLDIGNSYIETNTDKANIVIEGVTFESTTDREYSVFILLENAGGDLTDVSLRNCTFYYHPTTVTGADRWAITFGGGLGDLRARIFIENNTLIGPMQLTSGGQSPNYEDVVIRNNKLFGCRNAGIALTRLATVPDSNTYKRIAINDNFIHVDIGTIGIFLGADSSTNSPAPQVWDSVEIARNTIYITGAGTHQGIFVRIAQGAGSTFTNCDIKGNTIKTVTGGVIQIAKHKGDEPGLISGTIANNSFLNGEVLCYGGNWVVQGNISNAMIQVRGTSIMRASGNEIRGFRLEDNGALYSRNNVIKISAANGFGMNIAPPAGKSYTVESVGDSFEYVAPSGTPYAAYRLAGLGTINCKIYHPRDIYGGAWAQLFIRLEDNQQVAAYRAGT